MSPDDRVFQLILILGLVLILPVGIYHRVRSETAGDKLDRRQEGLFILLTLRPIGLATMLGLIMFVLNPAWMAWSSMPLPLWLRWVGVCVGVPTGGLLVWTFRSLGKNITDTVVTRRDHTLVTVGPYHYVRHPFYLATALAVIANSLTTANWFIAAAGTATFCLLAIRTTTEEQNLVKRFGDEYVRYTESTGRFLPWVGRLGR